MARGFVHDCQKADWCREEEGRDNRFHGTRAHRHLSPREALYKSRVGGIE